MKIAITGHLGTLGAPLTAKLRERGHDVTGIDLRHSHDGERADVADLRQLVGAMPDGVDLVYHLAAEFGRHNGEDFTEQLWRSNVIGTKNLLRLQEVEGFRMIFASSSEVYGEKARDILHERDIAQSGELTNDYAISKWVNEQQIENARKQWDTETMVLRFFNAYGPGEYYHAYRSVVCLFCYRALMGLPYDVYTGYHRVFQYVDDLVDTLANAARRFHPGETINVGGVEYRSVEEMHRIVSDVVGVDPDRRDVNRLSLDAHNIVNKRPDITKAQRMLGHHPTVKLEEGIAETVDWLRGVYANGIAAAEAQGRDPGGTGAPGVVLARS